jgi:multiple sugar transport system substrate-binding protein
VFRKSTRLIAAAIASSLLLAACSSGGATPTPATTPAATPAATTAATSAASVAPTVNDITATLTTYNWGSADEAKAYTAAFDRLKTTYPNVTVKDNVVPVTSWADYADALAKEVAAGNPPDIINIAIEGVRLAVSEGLLKPLDDYIAQDADAQALVNSIPKSQLDAYRVDGKLYLIPYNSQTMVVYYNPKIFDAKGVAYPKAGWTRDQFLAAAKATTGGGIYGFGQAPYFFQTSPWWFTNGASPVSADLTKPTLTDPRVIDAVQFVGDMINKYKVAPSPAGLDVWDMFAHGKLAMVGAGRWVLSGWKSAGFSDYAAVPWPSNGASTTVFGGAGWGISAASKNPALAWAAIKQLIGPKTQSDLANIGQGIPVLPSVAAGSDYQNSSSVAQLLFDQSNNNARAVTAPVFYNDLERIMMGAITKVEAGEATASDALTAAQTALVSTIGG